MTLHGITQNGLERRCVCGEDWPCPDLPKDWIPTSMVEGGIAERLILGLAPWVLFLLGCYFIARALAPHFSPLR